MSFFLEFISYFQVSDRVTWRKSWVLFSTVCASHYSEEEMIMTTESSLHYIRAKAAEREEHGYSPGFLLII